MNINNIWDDLHMIKYWLCFRSRASEPVRSTQLVVYSPQQSAAIVSHTTPATHPYSVPLATLLFKGVDEKKNEHYPQTPFRNVTVSKEKTPPPPTSWNILSLRGYWVITAAAAELRANWLFSKLARQPPYTSLKMRKMTHSHLVISEGTCWSSFDWIVPKTSKSCAALALSASPLTASCYME